jgi:hypothetical protein
MAVRMAGQAGFDSWQGREIFLYSSIQADSGVQPASYPMGTSGPSLGIKRPGRETEHSPPTSAEVKNGGAIPPVPHTSSWRASYLGRFWSPPYLLTNGYFWSFPGDKTAGA